jgi:hypothetical protein
VVLVLMVPALKGGHVLFFCIKRNNQVVDPNPYPDPDEIKLQ